MMLCIANQKVNEMTLQQVVQWHREQALKTKGRIFHTSAADLIESMGKDAERYHYLRDRKSTSNRKPHITQHPRQEFDSEEIPQITDSTGYHPERLDAAIDAALQKEQT